MTEQGLIDISQTLRVGMPGWPGDTAFTAETSWSHSPDCPVRVSHYAASTHADAPLHYDLDGAAIDGLALDAFVGPAWLLDLRGCGPVITPELVASASGGPTRLLFRTCERFSHRARDEALVTLAAEKVVLLASGRAVLVGIDAPSIDPREAKVLRAHEAARVAGLHILEGLVLDAVEASDYELIALPIGLGGLNAASVRAVLGPLS